MKKLIFILSLTLKAQTYLTGPIVALPKSDHSAAQAIASYEQTNTYYSGFVANSALTTNLIFKLPAAFPGALNTICSDTMGNISYGCGSGTSLPVSDTTIITYSNADNTKQMKFDDSGITTGTTRTLRLQDANYTIAGTNISNTFIGNQYFGNDIIMNGPGSGSAGAIDFDNPTPGIGAIKLTIPNTGGSPYEFILPPNASGSTSPHQVLYDSDGAGTTNWATIVSLLPSPFCLNNAGNGTYGCLANNTAGVYGTNTGSSQYAGYFNSSANLSYGVYSYVSGTAAYGVYSEVTASSSIAGYFLATSSTYEALQAENDNGGTGQGVAALFVGTVNFWGNNTANTMSYSGPTNSLEIIDVSGNNWVVTSSNMVIHGTTATNSYYGVINSSNYQAYLGFISATVPAIAGGPTTSPAVFPLPSNTATSGYYLQANGSGSPTTWVALPPIPNVPGSVNQIPYNVGGGAFGASANLTFNAGGSTLTVGGSSLSGIIETFDRSNNLINTLNSSGLTVQTSGNASIASSVTDNLISVFNTTTGGSVGLSLSSLTGYYGNGGTAVERFQLSVGGSLGTGQLQTFDSSGTLVNTINGNGITTKNISPIVDNTYNSGSTTDRWAITYTVQLGDSSYNVGAAFITSLGVYGGVYMHYGSYSGTNCVDVVSSTALLTPMNTGDCVTTGSTSTMSGNYTLSGNTYLRTYSGDPFCSGVSNGWIGLNTSAPNLNLCSGSGLYDIQLGSWTSWIPTYTHLNSVTTNLAHYNLIGKQASFAFNITGTTNSSGQQPLLSTPFTMYTGYPVPFVCTINAGGGYAGGFATVAASTSLNIFFDNNAAWGASTSYTIACSGVVETI